MRFDLGYVVDGAALSTKRTLAGNLLTGDDMTRVRGTGLGDVYVGSRGVGLDSLGTYLSTRARLAPDVTAPPIRTPYDRASDLQVRSAWAETDEVFQRPLLKPLRFRFLRQYVYGPAIAHMDGLLIAWETPGLEVHLYTGQRVNDWYAEGSGVGDLGDYSGLDVKVDLGAWRSIPLVLTASVLGHGAYGHTEITAAYARPSRKLVVRASARAVDGEWARERASARIQLSDVSQVAIDIDHRTRDDWRWDPEWVKTDRVVDRSRFLWLGPVTPRLTGSVRAGTVLLDNIDVLVRVAGAADLSDDTPDDLADASEHTGPFAAGYVEGGGAIELRLRRALALGISGLNRLYDRGTLGKGTEDVEGGPVIYCDIPDPMTPCEAEEFPVRARDLGERLFQEGSLRLRYTAGARRFSASAEIYARRTFYTHVYVDDDPVPETRPDPIDPSRDFEDRRGGGRFTIEAWPMPRVRILAEYDVSSIIETAPEIRGYKSLRLLAEASW